MTDLETFRAETRTFDAQPVEGHQRATFEGTWKVADTAGKAFEITLASDGSAKANRADEGMTGTWKEEGSAAVITWNDGWTTKISKDGEKYTKTAFKKGEPMDGKPANSSAAEKAK